LQRGRFADMRKVFADLHLRLNYKDRAAPLPIINKTAKLGYTLVAVPLSPQKRMEETEKLAAACKEAKIDFVSRIDLLPRNHQELMHQLRRLRRKIELICVLCENKAVSRQAAKDRRVDLLNFPSPDFRQRFFDKSEAELASNSRAALEIDVNPLLLLEGPARIRLLASLRQEVTIARKYHVPIVISSGVSTEKLLRKPRDMASLTFLFGLDEVTALKAVGENASTIVKRNREKLSSKFVAPGIKIVREGKDREKN
jgi:RNase P/RNase MRP subunit p30